MQSRRKEKSLPIPMNWLGIIIDKEIWEGGMGVGEGYA